MDEPRERKFYKVPAFGRELDLNLTLNRKFMSPNLVVETRHADGTVSYANVPKNTYYFGHVVSDPHSMVAVSDEGGLVCALCATINIHNFKTSSLKVRNLAISCGKLYIDLNDQFSIANTLMVTQSTRHIKLLKSLLEDCIKTINFNFIFKST